MLRSFDFDGEQVRRCPLNKALNTYWNDQHLRNQRVASRALPSMDIPGRALTRELIGTPAEVRRRGGLIPSWVVFGMIILSAFALCVTVNMRTHAERISSAAQYEKVSSDVDRLRRANAALESEVRDLKSNPRAIEMAARERLNMVRPNEIIVPIR